MDRLLPLLIIGLLIGCEPGPVIMDLDTFTIRKYFAIRDAKALEATFNSIDNSPNHHIYLDTGIYPNKKAFELATPHTFVRKENYFEKQVEYFYTLPDSSIKAIVYQWDKDESVILETDEGKEKKFKEFEKLWTKIVMDLEKHLGQPTLKEIESARFPRPDMTAKDIADDSFEIANDTVDTAWRDDMKWKMNQINAYLFMFGDNQTGYRQIRLAIYGE